MRRRPWRHGRNALMEGKKRTGKKVKRCFGFLFDNYCKDSRCRSKRWEWTKYKYFVIVLKMTTISGVCTKVFITGLLNFPPKFVNICTFNLFYLEKHFMLYYLCVLKSLKYTNSLSSILCSSIFKWMTFKRAIILKFPWLWRNCSVLDTTCDYEFSNRRRRGVSPRPPRAWRVSSSRRTSSSAAQRKHSARCPEEVQSRAKCCTHIMGGRTCINVSRQHNVNWRCKKSIHWLIVTQLTLSVND